MSRSLLHPPPAPPPTNDDGERSGQPARRPGIGRRGLAVLLAIAAVLGGTVGAGLLVVTGVTDDSSATTTSVVQQSTGDEAGSGGSAASLDAHALYGSTSAGVVSITARGISSESSVSPFGPLAGLRGHRHRQRFRDRRQRTHPYRGSRRGRGLRDHGYAPGRQEQDRR